MVASARTVTMPERMYRPSSSRLASSTPALLRRTAFLPTRAFLSTCGMESEKKRERERKRRARSERENDSEEEETYDGVLDQAAVPNSDGHLPLRQERVPQALGLVVVAPHQHTVPYGHATPHPGPARRRARIKKRERKESEVRSENDSKEEEETYLSPMMAFSTSQSSRHAPWEMMASETWQFCTLAGGRNLGEVKMGLRAS